MSDEEKNTTLEGGTAQPEQPAAPKTEEKPCEAAAPAAPAAPPKPEPPARPAPPKNPAEDEIRARFGDKVELKYGVADLEVHVGPEALLEVCEFLRRRAKSQFTFLRNLTAVDYKDAGQIEIVYHVCPFPDMTTVCIKCRVSREAPSVETVTGLWPGANWLEREVLDLFGVEFKGHPDPRRIMLPPEWEGHPLRKDYVHKEPELPCIPRSFKPTN